MPETRSNPYDLSHLRPFFWIFGTGLTVMGIAALYFLGVTAYFSWFVLAFGLTLLVLSLVITRVFDFMAGPPADVTSEHPVGREGTVETREVEHGVGARSAQ